MAVPLMDSPAPLLVLAAKAAFGSLPQPVIKQVGIELGIDTPPGFVARQPRSGHSACLGLHGGGGVGLGAPPVLW